MIGGFEERDSERCDLYDVICLSICARVSWKSLVRRTFFECFVVEHDPSLTKLLSLLLSFGFDFCSNCLNGLKVIKHSRDLKFCCLGVLEQIELDLCFCIELLVGFKIKGGTIGYRVSTDCLSAESSL